ncbi:btk-binding protein-related [Anaeramoeba flamelloides]|uniref:Btk-binding protein-related n=1 Tax=Anaeramoeba flamelloides TaxID=1746091 RepID=A0ABQ8XV37_9EUKA|nr:btk-binding protein-related [Anaeramoeba flamelloides]
MDTHNPKVYVSGYKQDLGKLVDQKNSNLPCWTLTTKIKQTDKIKKILIGNAVLDDPHLLVWKENDQLDLFFFKSNDQKCFRISIQNEEIKKIQNGQEVYFILTKSGKVYCLASGNNKSKILTIEIPLKDPENSSLNKPRLVNYFEENNIFIDSISITSFTNYFLSQKGKLYSSGFGDNGQCGNGLKKHQRIPILIAENVRRVFTGSRSRNFFYTTANNELFACGANDYGKLGISSNEIEISTPQKIDFQTDLNIDYTSQILKLTPNRDNTFVITSGYKIFCCGCGGFYQDRISHTKFAEIVYFKNTKITKIKAKDNMIFFQSSINELYGLGYHHENYPTEQFKNIKNHKIPIKINLPEDFTDLNSPFKIACGIYSTIIYTTQDNIIKNDFKKIFESKQYCDQNIIINSKSDENKNSNTEQIPIHKLLIELRTGLKIDFFQKIITEKQFTKEEINIFLKWVYCDCVVDANVIKRIFSSLELNYPPPRNSFENDFLKLYNDHDSKDFALLIKNEDADEEETLQGSENDDEFEEIAVHKLVLLSRCGLFRDLFENLNEKEKHIKQIKDYSGKSIESLEIFIKYLYLNKIELTADDDPDLIFEELEDATEYYQLNVKSNLIQQLRKNKK